MDDLAYEGVFFDIGGVLLDLSSVRAGHERFLTRFAEENGIEAVDEFVADWRAALGHYFSSRDGTTFRPALDGYRRAIAVAVALQESTALDREPVVSGGKEVPTTVPDEEWRPLFDAASAETLRPSPGTGSTVRALDEAGCYLGIVSDIDTWEAERMLSTFDVRDCFDRVTTSESVGRTKPDPAMFDAALDDAPVAPERSLYVGDRYDHDMRGGKRAGFTTVAHGGTAAENAAEDPDEVVDFVVSDLRELLDIVGVV
ncbi:HAD family hydrolase [Halomarina oriensis]|uniref:HAD-IA family hydrolase n=1 Tax=Halomarina oriensis TaxID=671145 RepID=A0A6B0GF40_9EURY|nr:HAD family hydrolase [Halomarina oriensis]MWG33576.1 HAD-IA family hydrolase [Halomarina oriensis]